MVLCHLLKLLTLMLNAGYFGGPQTDYQDPQQCVEAATKPSRGSKCCSCRCRSYGACGRFLTYLVIGCQAIIHCCSADSFCGFVLCCVAINRTWFCYRAVWYFVRGPRWCQAERQVLFQPSSFNCVLSKGTWYVCVCNLPSIGKLF